MNAKTTFLDCYVRPSPCDQLGFPDDLIEVIEKRKQNVVSPTPKRNDLVRLLQRALGEIEFEGAKPKPIYTG
jgi:hypothetical protein